MIRNVFKFEIFNVYIIGSSSVISTSNTRKITAIRKKCMEKGRRALFFGSNPHSNGDLFSRSAKLFLEMIVFKRIIITLIKRVRIPK